MGRWLFGIAVRWNGHSGGCAHCWQGVALSVPSCWQFGHFPRHKVSLSRNKVNEMTSIESFANTGASIQPLEMTTGAAPVSCFWAAFNGAGAALATAWVVDKAV